MLLLYMHKFHGFRIIIKHEKKHAEKHLPVRDWAIMLFSIKILN